MTAHITVDSLGVSAFHDETLVMNLGHPTVRHWMRIKEIEDWLTTLEEAMPQVPAAHLRSLEGLYFSLKTAHAAHLREHESVVTEAPSETDLMDYLTAYAFAMGREHSGLPLV